MIGCLKKYIVVFFCVSPAFIGCEREAPAQGANIVPPGVVTLQPIAQYYIGTDVSEPSGIIHYAKNNSFFVVSDSHKELYEIDSHGALLRTIPSIGTDLEGISLSRSGDTIYVVEERNRVVVSYLTNGTKISSFSADVATIPNNGLEGIAVDKNGHLFVLNEKLPGMLLEYLPNGTEIKRVTFSLALDYSDIFYDDSTDCLWVISDESKKIMKVSKQGDLLSQWLIPFSKGEGITIVRDTMYIVNDEDAKLYIFNKPK